MDTQQRPNGRHRLVYRPREDPGLLSPLDEASARIARAVREAVDAVSPLQGGADAQRRAVAVDVSGAILSEAFRMLAIGTAGAVARTLPGIGAEVVERAAEVLRAPLRPPPPVVDLTSSTERRDRG